MLSDGQIQLLIRLIDGAVGLDVLYLFGSMAAGTARADSDVDLAALFSRPVDPMERLSLATDLGATIGREVDLVDLDRASPILCMQVLRHGKILNEASPRRRVLFEAAVPGRYEDLQRIRKPQIDAMLLGLRRG